MKSRTMKIVAVLSILALALGIAGCAKTAAKIPELKIAASQGAGSYPLAPMVENNALQAVADKTLIEPWVTSEQITAMVTSNQVQFAVIPITNAIMLYNKGADIKLVNVAVWGMLYILSADESVKPLPT